MNYQDIKTFSERREEHEEHQRGLINSTMIELLLCEEIDDLREFIEAKPAAELSDIHTCSYFCARPACIKAQRDALRDGAFGAK